ncbi:mannoside acetylglucosaminyltransferase 1, variant 1 [Capsaspora owczarzaki ATCC 30864]|uniref:Mannoside acetylglucosaminyltransferase 1, variant 1 n=1 Tax=Capsaspora owczarzaki (strain ATCC 30864) TaxID=595528 RepID=A0A0D2WVX7_CAPO3|nr:mannoside acetylglucosaminyltransferase 1, variant 1 [Capsaspora owczarzaki ATCC 30864]
MGVLSVLTNANTADLGVNEPSHKKPVIPPRNNFTPEQPPAENPVQRIKPEGFVGGPAVPGDDYGLSVLAGRMTSADHDFCSQRTHVCPRGQVHIAAGSGKDLAYVCVGGRAAIKATGEANRGLNVLTMNEDSGRVTAIRHFDTYSEPETDFVDFIDSVNLGRLVVIVTLDDGAYQFKSEGRRAAHAIGSSQVDSFNFRGTWVVIGQKGLSVATKYEAVSPSENYKWGADTTVNECVPLNGNFAAHQTVTKEQFCATYEGYSDLCSHDLPALVPAPPGEPQAAVSFPIALVAGNRPQYLLRSLASVLALPGVNPDMITVFMDGVNPEPMALCNVFGVRAVAHMKTKSTSTMAKTFQNADMIAAHYFMTLRRVFELFPRSKYALIVEEDLEVSPDFLSYFSHTMPLMEMDPTVLCVSAWNDNGYKHVSQDPSMLYRTDFFPGLGWMLSRALWNEIMPKWPPCCYGWSWDLWLREDSQRKGRQCIMPDVSRTFHFGRRGLNVDNDHFYNAYFANHNFNTDPNAVLQPITELLPSNYDAEIARLLQKATPLSHEPGATPCKDNYVPSGVSGNVYTIWYKQKDSKDDKNLAAICSCFKMWDLGVRGTYKGVLRFFSKGNHILAVGSQSEFARLHMPSAIQPLALRPD